MYYTVLYLYCSATVATPHYSIASRQVHAVTVPDVSSRLYFKIQNGWPRSSSPRGLGLHRRRARLRGAVGPDKRMRQALRGVARAFPRGVPGNVRGGST